MFRSVLFAVAMGLAAGSVHAGEATAGAGSWPLGQRGEDGFEQYAPIGDPVVHEGRLVEGRPFLIQSMTYAGYGVLQSEVTNVRRGLLPPLSLKAGTAFYRTGTGARNKALQWCTLPSRKAPVCLYTENGVWEAVRPGGAPFGGYTYWQLASAPVMTEAAYPGRIEVRLWLRRGAKRGGELHQERDTTGPGGETSRQVSEASLAVLSQGDMTIRGGNGKGVRLHLEADGTVTAVAITAP